MVILINSSKSMYLETLQKSDRKWKDFLLKIQVKPDKSLQRGCTVRKQINYLINRNALKIKSIYKNDSFYTRTKATLLSALDSLRFELSFQL